MEFGFDFDAEVVQSSQQLLRKRGNPRKRKLAGTAARDFESELAGFAQLVPDAAAHAAPADAREHAAQCAASGGDGAAQLLRLAQGAGGAAAYARAEAVVRAAPHSPQLGRIVHMCSPANYWNKRDSREKARQTIHVALADGGGIVECKIWCESREDLSARFGGVFIGASVCIKTSSSRSGERSPVATLPISITLRSNMFAVLADPRLDVFRGVFDTQAEELMPFAHPCDGGTVYARLIEVFPQDIVTVRGSETPRRDVRLLDMRGAAAVVTLWGEAARSAGCWRALETDLLLVNTGVREIAGAPVFVTTFGTIIEVNPVMRCIDARAAFETAYAMYTTGTPDPAREYPIAEISSVPTGFFTGRVISVDETTQGVRVGFADASGDTRVVLGAEARGGLVGGAPIERARDSLLFRRFRVFVEVSL